jgi:uncharacterized protein YuzE
MEKVIKRKQNNKVINYDYKSDVLYIGLKKGIEDEFIEISPGVNIELDSNGKVIGVEILNASKILKPLIKVFEKKKFESGY